MYMSPQPWYLVPSSLQNIGGAVSRIEGCAWSLQDSSEDKEASSGAHLVPSLVCLEMLSSQNSLSSYYLDIFSMDSRIQAENKVALSSVLWP